MKKSVSTNRLMVLLSGLVLLLSLCIHALHRLGSFLDDYVALQGITSLSGGLEILLNVFLIFPIILYIGALYLYKKDPTHPQLGMLLTLTLTFSSISIIAGGDGLTEYHFSIFMVVAMIASFQRTSYILISAVIFAVHHFAGFFLFPQLLCGTDTYRFSLLMIHAIFLVLTAIVTITMTQNTVKTEKKLAHDTEVAEGQLKQLLHEIGLEGHELEQLSLKLAKGSDITSKASLEISEALQTLQNNTRDEAASLEQSIAQNNENLSQFSQIHTNTENVSEKAKHSINEAAKGKETVQKVTEQMSVITYTVGSINELIETLANQSSEISKLLAVIHSISEQTKLLALNASIEAARAGEHGKGFSVVASEIRNLAVGTQSSASEIDQVMENIQYQIEQVADKMEIGITEIDKGNDTIKQSEIAFDTIFSTISELEQDIQAISKSTTSLISQTDEVIEVFTDIANTNLLTVENIDVISEASKEQYQSVNGLNEAITSLNKLSHQMNGLINKIK